MEQPAGGGGGGVLNGGSTNTNLTVEVVMPTIITSDCIRLSGIRLLQAIFNVELCLKALSKLRLIKHKLISEQRESLLCESMYTTLF